jgi:hypothetical protein
MSLIKVVKLKGTIRKVIDIAYTECLKPEPIEINVLDTLMDEELRELIIELRKRNRYTKW